VTATPVAAVEEGPARLHSISESLQRDEELIHALYEHGMRAGEIVTVVRDAGEGVVRLELGGHRLELDEEAARLVFVVPV
jgi:Fe2+ transport system protein FeoA